MSWEPYQSNKQVIERWASGKRGGNATLTSNGATLKSYALVIGYTDIHGNKWVLDTPYSPTTRRHIGIAKRYTQNVASTPAHRTGCGYPCEHTKDAI